MSLLWANKSEYTLSDNNYTSFNHAKPHVLFIMFMFCLLDRIIKMCVSCFRAVQIWFFEYNYLILTTGCSTWHLMAKNSLRIWELELFRSSVTTWNWVTVLWPGSYRGFPRRVSLGTSISPDMNPIEHMWQVEKHHVSNVSQLRDVIMEEWKRMPATPVQLWWIPCPGGLRQC